MRLNALFLALALTACSDKFDSDDIDPNAANDDGGSDISYGSDGSDGTEDNSENEDNDGDGFTPAQGDCDDSNSTIYPSADEFCNGQDDDCDGDIDDADDLAAGQGDTMYEDNDGDGYGNPLVSGLACEFSEGWVTDNTDCDDTEASAYPGGVEVNWNDIDEDCDGADFDLAGCLDRAVAQTAVDLQDGSAWSVPDFYGTYDLTITLPVVGATTLTGAGFGEVTNQQANITSQSSSIYADGDDFAATFESSLGYNDSTSPFIMSVGIAPSYWTFGYAGITVGSIITAAINLVTTVPEGFDGSVDCAGSVAPKAADFDGTVALTVNASAETVTAEVNLTSNVTEFTEGDASLSSLSGGLCGNDIIDVIAGYIGIGSTYTFLNENLATVGDEMVNNYQNALEDNIFAECSGD
jgi:hypothetical protein